VTSTARTLSGSAWLAALLCAAPASGAELVVRWARLAEPVNAYQVERRIDVRGASFEPVARVDGTTTRFVDRAVIDGVRYCYRVRGVRGERISPPSSPLCNAARESSVENPPVSSPAPAPLPEAETATPPSPGDGGDPSVSTTDLRAQPERALDVALDAATSERGPLAAAAGAAASSRTSVGASAVPVSVAVHDGHAPALVTASSPTEPVAGRPNGEFREVKALRRRPPVYPHAAQLNGISGWVKLTFTVTAEGTTRDIRIAASEPPGVFDAAALEAARGFVYSPRIENGVAVDRPNVETDITFTWIDRGGSLTTDRRRPAPR
jgi:TonB family protein